MSESLSHGFDEEPSVYDAERSKAPEHFKTYEVGDLVFYHDVQWHEAKVVEEPDEHFPEVVGIHLIGDGESVEDRKIIYAHISKLKPFSFN